MSGEKGEGAPRTNADIAILVALLALGALGVVSFAWHEKRIELQEARDEYQLEVQANAQLTADHRSTTLALVALTKEIANLEDTHSIIDASFSAGDRPALEAAMEKLAAAHRASQHLSKAMKDLATTRESLDGTDTDLARLQVTSEFLSERISALPDDHSDRVGLERELDNTEKKIKQLIEDGWGTNNWISMYREQVIAELSTLVTEIQGAQANLSRQLSLTQKVDAPAQAPAAQQAASVVD